MQVLSIASIEQAYQVTMDLWRRYGLTIIGLMRENRQVTLRQCFEFVHNVDYTALRPNPELRAMLLSLPQKKFVFTNSDMAHTLRTLKQLGIEDCFDGIIDVFQITEGDFSSMSKTASTTTAIAKHTESITITTDKNTSTTTNNSITNITAMVSDSITTTTTNTASNNDHEPPIIVCKPQPEAYERALHIVSQQLSLSSLSFRDCVMFDDSKSNVARAKQLGMIGVLVSESLLTGAHQHGTHASNNATATIPPDVCDVAIGSVNELRTKLTALWSDKDNNDHNTNAETSNS
eukprot:GEZU01022792.1.p1 GENE.GEZU01022792.1~~GEZU01022792.1.p1  ORF type:complete len:291 (+),score=86.64 GEZU01022792.1:159-1031(+)